MIAAAISWVLAGIFVIETIAVWTVFWRRRPCVVRSDVLGRWVAARSRARFEAEAR